MESEIAKKIKSFHIKGLIFDGLLLLAAMVADHFWGPKIIIFACAIPIWKAIGTVIGLEILFFAFSAVLTKIHKKTSNSNEIGYEKAIEKTIELGGLGKFLAGATFASFVEEIAYRGLLNPLCGVPFGSFLFAISHIPRTIVHFLTLLVMGLIFSFEAIITGGLIVPMIHHCLHNSFALIVVNSVVWVRNNIEDIRLKDPELAAKFDELLKNK